MAPFDRGGSLSAGVKKHKAVSVKETAKVSKVPSQVISAPVKWKPSVKKKPAPEQVDLTPQISQKRQGSSLPSQADCAAIVLLGVAPCASVPPLPISTPLPLSGPSQYMPDQLGTSTEDNVTMEGLAWMEFNGDLLVPTTLTQNADVVPHGGDNFVIIVDD
ncbi:hypothetical protein H6P81_017943 [Aristolochia fimbriata]|uniref:Uncharacterized protein n=1 Tax=Aristolochia fimbriata TaxID=158543 RepID=A0AAV7E1G4_ARIFI|nr:hypothetical protein H6P81_017943 [Aristolochia fimbriata]